jgi:hypothetical protein
MVARYQDNQRDHGRGSRHPSQQREPPRLWLAKRGWPRVRAEFRQQCRFHASRSRYIRRLLSDAPKTGRQRSMPLEPRGAICALQRMTALRFAVSRQFRHLVPKFLAIHI